MTEPFAHPCVLVVADRERTDELVAALSELSAEVVVSAGGDDTLELFDARRPAVVVLTASLAHGDPRSLIVTLRGKVARGEIAIVVIGDDAGPIRTALDALDLAPDRFVTRPLSPKALRFAVTGGLEAVRLIRGVPRQPPLRVAIGTVPGAPAAEANGRAWPALPAVPRLPTSAPEPAPVDRAALRARWEALADSIMIEPDEPDDPEDHDGRDPSDLAGSADDAAPPQSAVVILPRRRHGEPLGDPAVDEIWKDDAAPIADAAAMPEAAPAPAESRTRTGDGEVEVTARTSSEELWSEPVAIAELVDREPRLESPSRELDVPLEDLADAQDASAAPAAEPIEPPLEATPSGPIAVPRDFARELREKMSIMAQRLFQGSDAPGPVDHAPRHDHHTEIDLNSLGDEPRLGPGLAEIETRAVPRPEAREVMPSVGSPSSWDTHVRERGLPDSGTIVRGVSDAPMLLARMFAQSSTGRVAFRRDEVETVISFDQGRPVFAASNDPRHRMGELLLREGKITASQYERCQTVVAESGRRMGEILVDFGYLKRRELLPAVRRHVEDLVYSLFGWEHGTYHIVPDPQPSAERIRLSRHPAALVLEGIRRKLDRTSLERLIGPASTVIEVRDRERLGGIVHLSDLSAEERAALAAFDGQADLAQVARGVGGDLADVLPLAWGLCVLGLATARRIDAELAEDTTALVGETDLAIDRERVRARWQLVTDADYFALLGVRRDATAFEIRRAYQSARRDFAAECFPGELRRELARELDDIAHVLDEAFRVLRDDRLRRHYLANLIDG